MNILPITLILLSLIVVFLFVEYCIHIHNLNSIPIRIHVNGTRGKSSVTRLIAGALREHGMKIYAKTTGTLPRMIMADGREYPIYRPAGANIIEQLRIVSLAASHNADALVVECMALQPILQSITELKFIRSTHGVITNARADHLDVMGPLEKDVAWSLLGTTPCNGVLFTGERDHVQAFESACLDRNSILNTVSLSEIESVSDEEMARFEYIEHKENVALALKVTDTFDVPRKVALKGMWKAKPDFGAMQELFIDFFERRILFINGFAANDPESSEKIWRMSLTKYSDFENKIMVLNTRADRPDRSRQLGEVLGKWPKADRYILIGTGVYLLFRKAVASGIEASKFVYAEGMRADNIFEQIMGVSGHSAMVTGIGNIGGPGFELVNYFRNRTSHL